MAVLAPAYLPRRPTETVLYGLVRQHLESFLAYAREHYEEGGLPRYVEQEFRAYLACGVSKGFTRCHCDACGHDLLVAFSCHGRSICPSCCGRRMSNTAAAIVDRVLPDVPVRQYVLSLPYELRRLAAFKADVLTALGRIFVEAIFASYQRRAEQGGVADGQSGAINFVQRFGSLNLHVHFHVMVLDGVFVRDGDAGVRFLPASAPTREELDAVVARVNKRAGAWLRRHGYFDGRPLEEGSSEPPTQTALDACAAIAMGRGQVSTLPNAEAAESLEADPESAPDKPAVAVVDRDGFNLHAGVRIEAGDDGGRERLARYGARPPLSLERLRRLPGGRVAYRLKYVSRGRGKHRVMSGLEFMARLAALVAPPRYPLVRYAGVLGPRSAWRKDVVLKPRERRPACNDAPHEASGTVRPHMESKRWDTSPRRPKNGHRPAPPGDHMAAEVTPLMSPVATPLAPDLFEVVARPGDVIVLTPNVLSVKHWDRLLGGALYAARPRVDWAALLRRTFQADVMACAKCGGRLRVLAVITEREPVRRILARLGLPPDAPPLARARDPTDDVEDVEPTGQLELGLS